MNNYERYILQLQLYRVELEVAKLLQIAYPNNERYKIPLSKLLNAIIKARDAQIPSYILKDYSEKQILEFFLSDFRMAVIHNNFNLSEFLENETYLNASISKPALEDRMVCLENKIITMNAQCCNWQPQEIIAKFKKHKYEKVFNLFFKYDLSVEHTILIQQINTVWKKEAKKKARRDNITSERDKLKNAIKVMNNVLKGTGFKIESNNNGRYELKFLA